VRADAEEQVLGVPLPQVRRERLGGELEAQYPAAQSIEVEYAGLRSLRVRVTDRTPVIAIVDDGTATRFDGGGVRIDEVPADGLELPVLQADEGVDAPAAARDGAALITALDGQITAPVEELRATRSGEFELRVRTEDGDAQILLGSAEDGERKARIAAVLLDEGHQTIDVSVPDVPVAG
jgi:cell division protein FtsQ